MLFSEKENCSAVCCGRESLENGMSIIGAHIDAPRLDLKPAPLYEESDMAYLKPIIMAELKISVGDHAAGASRHRRQKRW